MSAACLLRTVLQFILSHVKYIPCCRPLNVTALHAIKASVLPEHHSAWGITCHAARTTGHPSAAGLEEASALWHDTSALSILMPQTGRRCRTAKLGLPNELNGTCTCSDYTCSSSSCKQGWMPAFTHYDLHLSSLDAAHRPDSAAGQSMIEHLICCACGCHDSITYMLLCRQSPQYYLLSVHNLPRRIARLLHVLSH